MTASVRRGSRRSVAQSTDGQVGAKDVRRWISERRPTTHRTFLELVDMRIRRAVRGSRQAVAQVGAGRSGRNRPSSTCYRRRSPSWDVSRSELHALGRPVHHLGSPRAAASSISSMHSLMVLNAHLLGRKKPNGRRSHAESGIAPKSSGHQRPRPSNRSMRHRRLGSRERPLDRGSQLGQVPALQRPRSGLDQALHRAQHATTGST